MNTWAFVPALSTHVFLPVFVIVTESCGCSPAAYSILSVTASTVICFSVQAPPSAAVGSVGIAVGGAVSCTAASADGVVAGGAVGSASSPWLAPGRTMMSTITTMTARSPRSITSRRRRYTCGDWRPAGVRFVDMLTG